jgi:hypothetical protein
MSRGVQAENRNMYKHVPAILVLAAALACGPAEQQPAHSGNAPAAEAPSPGAGAPASPATPGTETPSKAAPGASTPSAPAEPAEPAMVSLDVPSGTELVLTLDTPLSSESAQPEQTVRATVAKPVIVNGMVAIPDGAIVTGTVVSAQRSGRVKGVASLALRFNEVTVETTPYKINTARISRVAEATKGEDAKKIAIGAGVGTAIGAIAGGKKGAAIGAGIGGGAGTGAVLATRGREVEIPAGATLRTKTQEPVTITIQKRS